MELNYYVLGKKNNPMLLGYLEKYYEKLCSMLVDIMPFLAIAKQIGILLQNENRKFILSADISSTIHILHDQIIRKVCRDDLYVSEVYEARLGKEIELFLSGDTTQGIMYQGSLIGDTAIRLTMSDYNPLGAMQSHPDHKSSGAGLGWGEKGEQQWGEVYSKTFEILKVVDEGVYDELNQIITKIIPFGTSYGLHNSCSHSDCIGHLYLGYTVDIPYPEFNNVEAVIHESSHNKLHLILQSEPLILGDFSEKYYSPYRPDARHIHGIYMGLHALTPVVYILMSAYIKGFMKDAPWWLDKIILYHIKNKIAYKVLLKHGDFTILGQEILDEMGYVIDLTHKLFQSIESGKEVLQKVIPYEKQHFSEVNIRYPHLQY